MDGLQRVSGAPVEITLNGKAYRATPFKLGMWGEMEAHIGSERAKRAIEDVSGQLSSIPAPYRKDWIDAAMSRAEKARQVSPEDVMEFLRSFKGLAFSLWCLLREHQPELTAPELVEPLMDGISLEELQMKIDAASGLNDSKKSDGPRKAKRPKAARLGPKSTVA